MEQTQVHISQIRSGDTILHNGEIKTVSGTDIKYSEFMDKTLFGDSYHIGYKLVTKINFISKK